MRFFPAALALCASSALAASAAPAELIAGVSLTTLDGRTNDSSVSDGECKPFANSSSPVRKINITPAENMEVNCTFYTGDKCDGEEYNLSSGQHSFNRAFYVGSYVCHKE